MIDNRPDLSNIQSSTDLKLDLLANQLKVNVVDSDSQSEEAEEEIIEEETSAVPSPPHVSSHHQHHRSRWSEPSRSESPPPQQPPPPRSPIVDTNDRYRKVELLRIFQELEQRGIRISGRYTIDSDLQDMEQEYEVLKSIENKKAAVKLYKSFMVNGIQALEFMNETYNPFDFHLKGWSEHVSLNSEDYNEVLGDLYEKYKHTGRKVEPEIKLVLMLMMSATTFHASNSLLKSFFPKKPAAKPAAPPQPPPPPTAPPQAPMKGPNPKEFLERLRRERQSTTRPPAEPVIIEEEDDTPTSTTTSTVTTTTRRKKPPMMINL